MFHFLPQDFQFSLLWPAPSLVHPCLRVYCSRDNGRHICSAPLLRSRPAPVGYLLAALTVLNRTKIHVSASFIPCFASSHVNSFLDINCPAPTHLAA